MKHIGIYIERQRAWGRRVCEGVADFAQSHQDWSLHMLEREDITSPKSLRQFDGFIARVPDSRTASAFRRTGRPVADMSVEGFTGKNIFPGVQQDNQAIGQLAAQHFMEYRFVNFAFCGYSDSRFSKERHDSFAEALNANGFTCSLYETTYDKDDLANLSERLDAGLDASGLSKWLKSLPPHCGVFCANDIRAYQALKACTTAKLSVPGDIALLGVDNDTLICNFTNPTLSSIDPDAFGLGVAAAELLDQWIGGTSPSNISRKIAPRELVVRGSSQTFPIDPPWIAEALAFIRRNYHRHLSATEVYAHLKLSHTWVDAMFRKVLGTTVTNEIRRVSLEEALRLLAHTDLPIANIAKRTGFASPQYFCNVFCATYGKSPSAWREK